MKKIKGYEQYKVRGMKQDKLGANAQKEGICFSIAVQTGTDCSLLLYKAGESEVMQEVSLTDTDAFGEVRSVFIEKASPADLEYNYLINGRVIQDPYAKKVVRPNVFGKKAEDHSPHTVRCGFLTGEFDWEDDTQLCVPCEETVMYAAHPRGFTKQAQSRVRHKGTFLGIQEKIPYLLDLGINQLELQPVYDFDEYYKEELEGNRKHEPSYTDSREDRVHYWGYVKGNYFAPKMSYSFSEDAALEFKTLIKTLHKNGIECILEFYFGEGMNPQAAVDCLIYWVKEYHIDGFHLSGSIPAISAIASNPFLKKTKLMSVHFPIDEIYKKNYIPSYKNLFEYNDGFMVDVRKLLKGDENQINSFLFRMKRNPEKTGVVNYIANHDGFTLMDLVSYDEKHNEENGEDNRDGSSFNFSWNCGIEGKTRKQKVIELRKRQMKNALTMVLLSQGTPLIYGGDEIGNTQNGNNNVYCQDNEIGWIDWRCEKRNQEILEYMKNLIQFRKAHPILKMVKELRVMDSLSCGYPDLSYHGEKAWYGGYENGSRQIGMMYCGKYAGEDSFIYIAYNLHWESHLFALPKLPEGLSWFLAGSTAGDIPGGFYKDGGEKLLEDQRILEVTARTIAICIGVERKETKCLKKSDPK